MAKGDVLINLVLDQSGSMNGVAQATIDGVNAFLEEQRGVVGDAYLTLTLFDSEITVRYEAGDLKLIPLLAARGDNAYQPSGSTALYDGVGRTVEQAEKWLADNPTFDGQVVFVVLTDGEENASRHWTLDMVNTAIRDKKEAGWEFVFMGSGGAGWTESRKLDVNTATTINFAGNAATTTAAYSALSTSLSQARVAGVDLSVTMPSNTGSLQADPTLQERDG
jgi:hypothetical protein